jgi:transposase
MRDVLLPTLKAVDILVMENLSTHKDRQALDLLHQAGVTLRFLPAYLSDYNPIEMMWSKVKSLLRKIEARDNESLLVAIGDALSQVTQKDATNRFSHCGYNFV